MKRILVSGGAGFLGSHLCEELLARGNKVLCMDTCPAGQGQNIAHLLGNPRFEWVPQESPIPCSVEVDEIYNFPDPEALPPAPFTTAQTLKPARGASPDLLFSSHLQRQLAIKGARLFHPYGPRMLEQDGQVLQRFILQALEGAPLTVPGTGAQALPFCYVDDLIAGMILLMESPGEPDGIVNIEHPIGIPLLELAQRIIQLTGSRSQILFAPLSGAEIQPHPGGPPLARFAPGWEPRIPLEIGLQRTLDHIKWTRNNQLFSLAPLESWRVANG